MKSGAGGVDPPLAVATLNRGSPNLTEAEEQGYLGFVGQTGVEPGLRWTLSLASSSRTIRRQVKGGEQYRVQSRRKKKVAIQLRPVSGGLNKK